MNPWEGDEKWFFERFAKCTVAELKQMTGVYRWPHNKSKKPPKPKPVIVRTPTPPPPPKKPEIYTMEKMGDEFSIKPAKIIYRRVGNGPLKEKYQSYWMQIVEKLNSNAFSTLVDLKDEIGYYKLWPWYAKKQALLKSMLTIKEHKPSSLKTPRSKKPSRESSPQKKPSLPQTAGISKFEMGNSLSKLPDINVRGSSGRTPTESHTDLNPGWKDFSDLDIFHTQAYPGLSQSQTSVVLSQINLCYNSYHDFCHEKESHDRHNLIFDEHQNSDTTQGLIDEENTELETVIQGLIEKEDLAWDVHQQKMEDEKKILGLTAYKFFFIMI